MTAARPRLLLGLCLGLGALMIFLCATASATELASQASLEPGACMRMRVCLCLCLMPVCKAFPALPHPTPPFPTLPRPAPPSPQHFSDLHPSRLLPTH